MEAKKVLDADTPPNAATGCQYCGYVEMASELFFKNAQ